MTVTRVDNGPRKVSRTAVVSAPVAELFGMLADPHRHSEVDGSGTVQEKVTGPDRLVSGDRFTVAMKMYGVPYKITSRVTELTDNRVVEWQHPAGHRWRWDFKELTPDSTQVTETFDYSRSPTVSAKTLEWTGFVAKNAKGIRSTLEKLQRRYARS